MPVGIVTNAPAPHLETAGFLPHEIAQLAVVTRTEMGDDHMKPDKKGMDLVVEKLQEMHGVQILRQHSLYVGDTIGDMGFALNGEVAPVGVLSGMGLEAHLRSVAPEKVKISEDLPTLVGRLLLRP